MEPNKINVSKYTCGFNHVTINKLAKRAINDGADYLAFGVMPFISCP